MSCAHVERILNDRTILSSIDTILRYVVFPTNEKSIKYRSSLSCHFCREYPVKPQSSMPCSLLACAHCVHFSCFTRHHIHDHMEENPDHKLSISIDQGELYCSVCQDFVYTERTECFYQDALLQHNKMFGQSERPWRPPYKDFKYFPYLKPVCFPASAARGRQTRGLVNMGNTCFLNVVIQALTHTPIFRDFLLADLHRCDNPVDSRKCLACEMMRITQEIYRPVMSPYVPSNLLHIFWLHASQLAGYEQRDAHEFLITLLTLIHSHLVGEHNPKEGNSKKGSVNGCSPSKRLRWYDNDSARASPDSARKQKTTWSPSSITSTTTGEFDEASPATSPQSTASDRTEVVTNNTACCGGQSSNCDCIVHQVFYGNQESVISYEGCDHRSVRVDPFLDLPLDVALPRSGSGNGSGGTSSSSSSSCAASGSAAAIASAASSTLADCLAAYFQPEALDGVSCSRCDRRRPAVKQFSLLHLPNVLCFYLKRCHQDTKINTSISFPEELDLSPYVARLAERLSWHDRYSLFAVLNHSGQTNSGHYTAFIRTAPGSWCLCDDQKILPVSLERVLNTDAYVLLYHKNLLAFQPSESASSNP